MNDFLKELDFLGVTARIKRLNDSFNHGIRELYRSQGLDIEPSWHLVLIIIKNEGSVNLVEVANRLHISQPAVTKLVNNIIDKGYIEKMNDPQDSRAKRIKLSDTGKKEFPKWETVWEAGQKAVREMLQENVHFITSLTLLEEANSVEAFQDRAKSHLK